MIFMKTQSNFYLFLIALISAMGGFLFGYDWVVIGGAKPFYEQYFGIANDPVMQGWAMSSALIGCLFGALSAGKLSDRLGRKPILILAAGLFICTAVGTGAVHSFTFFNVFRLVGGFAIGIASSLSPMYIAEIAPAHLRGRFVSINQLTVVLGILTSQIVNWQIAEPVALGATHEMIRESWNGQMGWRWMFWAMTVPAALFFVFSFILPESPRWLASSGKREAALKVFTRMGGKEYAVTELAAIEAASACQTQEGGFRQLLNPAMYKVLTIGVVMAILQQWCGINVIFNYAQEIFMAAGYGVSDVLMNIVVTGITNVIFTILAMFVVDRWGRKALTLIGSFGLAVIYTFMGAAYYFHITGVVLLIIVVMAIACYAMTLATVMWVIISEIFPNRIRGVAMSVCTFALWAACFILTYTFPMLNSGLGAAGTFWLYGLICLAGGIFVVFRLPETKGKSLEEIEKERQAAAEAEARRQQAAAAANQNKNNTTGNTTNGGTSNGSNSSSSGSNNSYVSPGNSSTASAIVNAAYSQLGTPYVWGGTSPNVGLDCSGLVQYCHRVAGISLPRTSGPQGSGGQAVSNPQPGDVVCYSGHVGIYIGGGQMIHAPQPGDVVKIQSVYGRPWYRRYW